MPDIKAIQSELRASKIDGWLFYDHHRRDPIANIILKLGGNGLASRRWFYFIPSKGEPRKLVHRIEAGMLDSLDGRKYVYSGWEEVHKTLPKLLSGSKTIAMQYSPENNIPYIGLVDAGTVELVRKLKKKVVSSANLVQKFEASWSNEQLESHLDAGKIIDRMRQDAFLRAAAFVREGKPLTEYELQQWIAGQFRANGLRREATIVAVQPNNGNPHYEPKPEGSRPIRAGDLLLLDMWAKFDRPGSVFYDITWMGYLGNRVPGHVRENIPHRQAGARQRGGIRERSRGRRPRDPRMGSGPRRARDDSQSRLREIFRPPHRPQHRRKYSRQRRQHGRPRNSRRPENHSAHLLFDRARDLSAGVRDPQRSERVRGRA